MQRPPMGPRCAHNSLSRLKIARRHLRSWDTLRWICQLTWWWCRWRNRHAIRAGIPSRTVCCIALTAEVWFHNSLQARQIRVGKGSTWSRTAMPRHRRIPRCLNPHIRTLQGGRRLPNGSRRHRLPDGAQTAGLVLTPHGCTASHAERCSFRRKAQRAWKLLPTHHGTKMPTLL